MIVNEIILYNFIVKILFVYFWVGKLICIFFCFDINFGIIIKDKIFGYGILK